MYEARLVSVKIVVFH